LKPGVVAIASRSGFDKLVGFAPPRTKIEAKTVLLRVSETVLHLLRIRLVPDVLYLSDR